MQRVLGITNSLRGLKEGRVALQVLLIIFFGALSACALRRPQLGHPLLLFMMLVLRAAC